MHPYVLFDRQYLPLPFGLANTGVICWLNSTLQALLSCTALNQVVLEIEDELSNEFALEYARLVRSIVETKAAGAWNSQIYMNASIKIQQAFISRVRAKYPRTPIGVSQECADEAFTIMIDLFDHPRIAGLFNNVYELRITCPICQDLVSTVRDRTYKIDVFTRHALGSAKQFTDYLRIHPSPVDSYTCPKCVMESRDINRIERLAMLREIVVLTFNKYQAKAARFFPGELVFPAVGGGQLVYRQVAQIEHVGGQSSGHYYADVLRDELATGSMVGDEPIATNDARFYRANDSSIVPNAAQPTPNTYMVIYHLAAAPQQ